jgi:fructan beta-fructosidase
MTHRTRPAAAAAALLLCLAAVARAQSPDIVIADFEGDDYGEWSITGDAFGPGPARGTLANQMAVSGFAGQRLANSYHDGDDTTGTLTSPQFTIERDFIAFLVGGGGFEGKTAVNLLVDGRVVRTATGVREGSEELGPAAWDVTDLRGRRARIQVVDDAKGGWGHVLVDHVVQTDKPAKSEPAWREVVADRRYLLLPVKNGSAMRKMTVAVDGRVEREMAIELADGQPDWWAVLDVEAWSGKPLRLEVDRLPGGSRGLEQVTQSDALPEGDPATRADRPLFHFAPPRGWINDPNGLVFHNGEFHLFYQFNPYGTRWQNMSWGHAVSRDLVGWQDLGVALHQQNGIMIFSGQAAVDHQNTSDFGADGKPPIVAAYTGHRVDGSRQTQDLAFSLDDGRTWTKYAKNPVLDINNPNFRDPKVFWHEPTKKWVMAVVMADERRVHFYGSPNLREWKFLSHFGPAGAPKKANWECPDLFQLPVEGTGDTKWVLHVGMGDGTAAGGSGGEYFVGDFDGTTFTSDEPLDTVRWADYGRDFYAAVTWENVPASDGRRIWIGWMNNWRYANDIPTARDWRGMMSVPRTLGLRRSGDGGALRLTQRPVQELTALRGAHRAVKPAHLDPGVATVHERAGEAVEIVADLTPKGAREVGLKVRVGGGQETVVGYDVAKQELFIDRTKSGNTAFHADFPGRHAAPLKAGPDGKIKLRVLVDRYSVEVFGNDGEAAVTDLIFPSAESQAVQVYSDGGGTEYALDLWTLNAPAQAE